MPNDSLDASSIFVPDAGLVLVAPYFSRLWGMTGLVEDQAFVDPEAAEHAAHLLRFIAFGDACADEPRACLGRLLCGLPLASPPGEASAASLQEQEMIHQMLEAMISHWTVLGHTSIKALRETFLQRQGRLVRGEDCWNLIVEPGPFDVLLDRLPWAFRTCKFAWMPETVHVSWR